MKRVLSLVLALSMVMSMFTFSFAGTSLKDIAGTEYESAVEALVELGIVNGYDDGTFLPENVVSRAEMAKLLVVAAGLAPAAELAEGTTKFADVAATHWATGYINVAAEYGYIMGDPDGNFRPDDTVSYAEAITMALRVLGYKTVVEAKGTWPTNYIAKAEELDLLEDITYGSYATGATRGNVALLIWNMLRLPMWDVNAESEGDGLEYTKTDEEMLEIKFKDYEYKLTTFVDYEIIEEGKVEVELGSDKNLEYAKTNFYTFVPGSEVEVLINTEDGTLLSMVATDEYKYLAGGKVDIDDKYDDEDKNFAAEDKYTYAFTRIDGKKLVAATELVVESEYIYEIDDSSEKKIKLNDNAAIKYEDMEDQIVLKDGEIASIEDVKVGDVWSTIKVIYRTSVEDGNGSYVKAKTASDDRTFYMISGAEAEGKLTKIVGEDFEMLDDDKNDDYYVATIDGEKVYVANDTNYEAVYFMEDDDEPVGKLVDEASIEMRNEVITYVTDFLGRVVAVMFDDELNGGDASDAENTVAFYALLDRVDRNGKVYTIAVENEDGEDELTFAKNAGNASWAADEKLEGKFTIVTLNDDGEIIEDGIGYDLGDTKFEAIAVAEIDEEFLAEIAKIDDKLVYELADDKDEEDKVYSVKGYASATMNGSKIEDDDKNELAKVNSNTVVVALVYDDNGTKSDDSDDEYTVEFRDISDIENMKKDPIIVITDEGSSNFARAKYVVIFDDVATREDDLVGIVKEQVGKGQDKLEGETVVIVEDRDEDVEDGKEYIVAKGTTIDKDAQFIVFSIEENDDGEWELTSEAKQQLLSSQLVLDSDAEKEHAYIAKSDKKANSNVDEDGRAATIVADTELATYLNEVAKILSDDNKIDLADEDTAEYFEDARIFIVNVVVDADEDEEEKQYFVDNYKEVEYADVELKELDRISFLVDDNYDCEGVLIIRGMKERTA